MSEVKEVDIQSFKMGNVVELEPLLAGLDQENVLLQVMEIKKTSVTFMVTYFGVLLGTAVRDAAGGWQWVLQ